MSYLISYNLISFLSNWLFYNFALDVRCQVCNKKCVRSKYRRHLLLHMRHQLIDIDEVNSNLFNTKLIRRL